MKAVFLRLEENNRDAIFEVSQMAKTMPEPLGRWIGELADQGVDCGAERGYPLSRSGME